MERIPSLLRFCRRLSGLSLQEIFAHTGIDTDDLYYFEEGLKIIDSESLLKICCFYCITRKEFESLIISLVLSWKMEDSFFEKNIIQKNIRDKSPISTHRTIKNHAK